MPIIIGVDNGPSGSIGLIEMKSMMKLVEYHKVPTVKYLNYQKSKVKHITRLDHVTFSYMIQGWLNRGKVNDLKILIERPVTNKFLQSMISGARFMEAMLVCLEKFSLGYEIIDSKEWQKIMLPKFDKKTDTKKLSLEVAKKLYPNIDYTGFKDADGLLICEWGLRQLMRLI